MRPATSEILPIWRSRSQVVILHSLFSAHGEVTASSIAQRFGFNRASVNAEVQHLVQAGLVVRRDVGRAKVLELADGHPALQALRTLVELTIGPLVELPDLYRLQRIERVAIFGSWARRHNGEPGPRPADIDVLVVGSADMFAVSEACLPIAGRLGLPVNPHTVTREQLESANSDPVLHSIVSGALVEVPRP